MSFHHVINVSETKEVEKGFYFRKALALQVVTVNQSNIAPKECVMYSKTTQTMGGGDREDRFGKSHTR